MPKKIEETKEKKQTKKEVNKSTVNKKVTSSSTATKKKSTNRKPTTNKKRATTKSATSKKTSTKPKAKKTTSTKRTTTSKKPEIIEYYDLPYHYNQTVVKVLAQTPSTLFIYWDISDEDRNKYEKEYGKDFFTTTKPVLIIYNKTLNYHFEVEINDFANSWYLHVNDSKCEYHIELGRRPIEKKNFSKEYIYISSSNDIESPNDHILFNEKDSMIYFRNVKTNKEIAKSINQLSLCPIVKIQSISNLYKKIYTKKDLEEKIHPSSPIKSF